MLNGSKLIGIMAEQGMSQRKLAQCLNVSKNTINAKINGKSCFNAEEIIKICSLLGISDDQLKVEIFLREPSQK